MFSKKLLTFAVGVTLATIAFMPGMALAQLPPPPIAPAGPPPMPAAGPPAFAGPAQSWPRAGLGGPALRGPAAGPRADLTTARNMAGGRAVVNSGPSASVNISRSGAHGYHYGGSRYGSRAAAYAGAYAAGAYAGYAYGGSRRGYYSDSDCYYVYRRYRSVLVCD
jgi:hypothetical protein